MHNQGFIQVDLYIVLMTTWPNSHSKGEGCAPSHAELKRKFYFRIILLFCLHDFEISLVGGG